MIFCSIILLILTVPLSKNRINEAVKEFKGYLSNSSQRSSTVDRLKMWKISLKMFSDKPMTGVGSGIWQEEFEKYCEKVEDPEICKGLSEFNQPHNMYLEILSTRGFLGFLTTFTLIFYIFKIIIRNGSEFEKTMGINIMSNFLIMSFFDSTLLISSFTNTLILLIGILLDQKKDI